MKRCIICGEREARADGDGRCLDCWREHRTNVFKKVVVSGAVEVEPELMPQFKPEPELIQNADGEVYLDCKGMTMKECMEWAERAMRAGPDQLSTELESSPDKGMLDSLAKSVPFDPSALNKATKDWSHKLPGTSKGSDGVLFPEVLSLVVSLQCVECGHVEWAELVDTSRVLDHRCKRCGTRFIVEADSGKLLADDWRVKTWLDGVLRALNVRAKVKAVVDYDGGEK